MDDLDFKADPMDGYRINLRAATRAAWSGDFDYLDFWITVQAAVRRAFTQAWLEGAKAYGISEEELTPAERQWLEVEIAHETSYISRFADAIEAGSKANGGKLTPLLQRTELWVKGYERIRQLAKVYAGKDTKLVWKLNPAEHCPSCLKLAGKVKRASYWKDHGVLPKAWDKLQCRLGCKCSLEPTTDRATPGPLPSLP